MTKRKLLSKQVYKESVKYNYYLLPLFFIIAFIPLIVRLHTYKTNLVNFPWFSNDNTAIDLFLYWKSYFFIFSCIIITCIILFKIYKDHKSMTYSKIFVPLIIYAVLISLSSIFSKFSMYSYHGIYEQFESLWVLLGYCIVTFYAFNIVKSDEDLKYIIRWLIVGITLICIIGLSQLFLYDFYSTALGKMTYIPLSLVNKLESVDFTFEPGRVYMSLYNPNYVGTYTSMIIPIFLIMILFNRKSKYLLIYITLTVCLLFCLFGSQSRSGMIALMVSIIFMILIFREYIFKLWKYIIVVIISLLVIFSIVNIMSNNVLLTRILNPAKALSNVATLNEIQTNKDNLTIIYNHELLKIKFNTTDSYNEFILTDKNGQTVNSRVNQNGLDVEITDSRFPTFVIAPVSLPECLGFLVRIDGLDWYFTNQTGDGTYYYYTNTGKYDKITNPNKAFSNSFDSFASTRGYIWSRTLPLLKENIFFGSGADTFALAFPNDDYVGKYNNAFINSIVTKPHNMYLQIGVQTGLLSLVAFLVFYGMYFISSIKLYFKNKFNTYMSQLGVGIFLGTIGYMVSGITNDSTITVAPIFWCLIGIGMRINYNLATNKS